MAYANELLETAALLCSANPPTQATIRRSISTAYYALFHLLIEDACNNWARTDQRVRLARQFDQSE